MGVAVEGFDEGVAVVGNDVGADGRLRAELELVEGLRRLRWDVVRVAKRDARSVSVVDLPG